MSEHIELQPFHELLERSKDDRAMIVGSEVRVVIGAARAALAQIATLTAQVERMKELLDQYYNGCYTCYANGGEHSCDTCQKAITLLRGYDATWNSYFERAEKAEAEIAALREGATVTYRVEFWQEPYKLWQKLISPVPKTAEEALKEASICDGEHGYVKGQAIEIITRERVLDAAGDKG